MLNERDNAQSGVSYTIRNKFLIKKFLFVISRLQKWHVMSSKDKKKCTKINEACQFTLVKKAAKKL